VSNTARNIEGNASAAAPTRAVRALPSVLRCQRCLALPLTTMDVALVSSGRRCERCTHDCQDTDSSR
jgi:hypothetical protein